MRYDPWDDYDFEIVDVYCTDTEKSVEANVIRKSQTELVVDFNGVNLKLYRQGRIYVGNMAGMEFTVKF